MLSDLGVTVALHTPLTGTASNFSGAGIWVLVQKEVLNKVTGGCDESDRGRSMKMGVLSQKILYTLFDPSFLTSLIY